MVATRSFVGVTRDRLGVENIVSGTGEMVIPARTLFVSQAWPAGADPLIFFTTIAAAETQAATMTPTADNPVAIVISPGDYGDALFLVSNVHLFAWGGAHSVIVSGPVSWHAGAAVNAPQAAVQEEIDLVLIDFQGPWLINNTAKTGNISVLDARDCDFGAGVIYTGRPGLVDFWQVWNANMVGGAGSFNNVNVNIYASTTDVLDFNNHCSVDVRACKIMGVVNVLNTSAGAIEASQFNGPVNQDPGTTMDYTGCRFQGGALTVAAGGVATNQSPYEPSRTLFVATAWPIGLDPGVYFTTISAALVRAAALNPTLTNSVAISIAAGTYTENLTLVSNVNLRGAGGSATQIAGTVSWLAGQGVNAPQAALTENCFLSDLFIANAQLFTFDSTAKTASPCALTASEVTFTKIVCNGRGISLDTFAARVCVQNNSAGSSYNNMTGQGAGSIGVEWTGCRVHQFVATGNTVFRMSGGYVLPMPTLHTFSGTSTGIYDGVSDLGVSIVANAGTSVTISGSTLNATLSGAGAFDVRGCNFGGNADITGITGTCNRSVFNGTTPVSAAGNNTVPIVPPYPDANYNVVLQLLTPGGGGASASTHIASKAGGNFVYFDATVAGGNTYDYVISHE